MLRTSFVHPSDQIGKRHNSDSGEPRRGPYTEDQTEREQCLGYGIRGCYSWQRQTNIIIRSLPWDAMYECRGMLLTPRQFVPLPRLFPTTYILKPDHVPASLSF